MTWWLVSVGGRVYAVQATSEGTAARRGIECAATDGARPGRAARGPSGLDVTVWLYDEARHGPLPGAQTRGDAAEETVLRGSVAQRESILVNFQSNPSFPSNDAPSSRGNDFGRFFGTSEDEPSKPSDARPPGPDGSAGAPRALDGLTGAAMAGSEGEKDALAGLDGISRVGVGARSPRALPSEDGMQQ